MFLSLPPVGSETLHRATQGISNYDNAFSIESNDLHPPKQITSMQLLVLTEFIILAKAPTLG